MLAKLLKYEMKASARTLIPLYIGTLIAAVICGFGIAGMIGNEGANFVMMTAMYGNGGAILLSVCYLLFFALCVATVVLTAMVIIQRFNKSLIGDEGYLMFTLPVTHTELLSSKLIAAMLWVLAGTLVMFLSGVIIGLPIALTNIVNWGSLWTELSDILHYTVPYLLATLVTGLFSTAATILIVYLSIMLAQTERFNQHRVVVAVVLFFLINWVFDAIGGILFFGGVNMFFEPTIEAQRTLVWYVWAQAAYALVQCIICFMGTKWLMQKKLNL